MIKYQCIHLRGATERRAHCDAQFAREGLAVSYFAALDARQTGLCHPLLNVGHTGCYLSHYMLAQQIGGDDITVVFEDDIILADGFAERVGEAIRQLPDDWQVAFVGWAHFEGSALPPLSYHAAAGPWISIDTGCIWGTHAYVIRGSSGAGALLRSWQPIRTTVDSQIMEDILLGRLRAYFLHPAQRLAWQADFPSQIAGS